MPKARGPIPCYNLRKSILLVVEPGGTQAGFHRNPAKTDGKKCFWEEWNPWNPIWVPLEPSSFSTSKGVSRHSWVAPRAYYIILNKAWGAQPLVGPRWCCHLSRILQGGAVNAIQNVIRRTFWQWAHAEGALKPLSNSLPTPVARRRVA